MDVRVRSKTWRTAVYELDCPLEQIAFARMLFEDLAGNLYAADGDPIVHESLVGRSTPAVEAAFKLYRQCEDTQLEELRCVIRDIVNQFDPYLLRQSAQWLEMERDKMTERVNRDRMRAAEIERMMEEAR